MAPSVKKVGNVFVRLRSKTMMKKGKAEQGVRTRRSQGSATSVEAETGQGESEVTLSPLLPSDELPCDRCVFGNFVKDDKIRVLSVSKTGTS